MIIVEINRKALANNAYRIKKIAPLIAVVKADAYGTGAKQTVEILNNLASMFAVSSCNEACEIVNLTDKDILILGKPDRVLPYNNIVYTVSSLAELHNYNQVEYKLAIKINSGMNRFGADFNKADSLIKKASCLHDIHSIYSHLRAGNDDITFDRQLNIFDNITKKYNYKKHLLASNGLYRDNYTYDYVRCGYALYGGCGFDRVVKITTTLLEKRYVRHGDGVGYGVDNFLKNTTVGVIDIGYADGFRRLTNERFVWLGGKKCRLLAVCMDSSIIEINCDCKIGDEVEVLGENITLDDLAKSYNTIGYEVLTSISRRAKKIYI